MPLSLPIIPITTPEEIVLLVEPVAISPYLPSRRATLAEGQPISELMSRALDNPGLISLAAGFVDGQTLPVEAVRDVMSDLLGNDAEARAMLQYGATPGLPALRRSILAQCTSTATAQEMLDRVVVTAGSNQLLHLVAESLLDPGDIVLCAAPTYLVFLGTVANLAARTWSVETDDLGMIPEALEATLQQLAQSGDLPRVKAIYLVPYFDNPSGITMPAQRVQRIVEIAKQWSHRTRIHVIADEAYRELRYAGDDVPSASEFDEDGETVIVAGTFSKSFSPGVRVGWGILPEHLVAPVCAQKGNIDFGSPNFNQHLMAEVLRRGLFVRHVEKLRASYHQKLDAMLAAADELLAPLERVTWRRPIGGLYVWATLPPEIDTGPTGELCDRAIAEGVLYVPGQYCYPAEGQPIAKNTMRLSFGVQSCERIREGIAALARAIQAVT
ncbi:MAG: PLP-dependent aminotransferase family protein [Planctomycetota bacterium]